ncbi:MAG TPA: hypothetical protein VEU47_07835 [Candidatus Cybelea sp.]|nr:hypothetical protein [Candidatus Cybelea sp.]
MPSVGDFRLLSRRRLKAMMLAADEIRECARVLGKTGANVVSEMLRGQGTFYEWNHYPEGDVFDEETHAQFYYHAHRGPQAEHGHFHTFLRAGGMPKGVRPLPGQSGDAPRGTEALSHLVAISMDPFGVPIGLFAVNRWVTGETWYAARDVLRMLDSFEIDHAYPSWPVNRWLGAMLRLFAPQVEALVRQRDDVVLDWARRRPLAEVLEDRTREITGWVRISVNDQVRRVEKALQDAR